MRTAATRFVRVLVATTLTAIAFTAIAFADPALGFRESFPGVTTGGFSGGSATSNPGTGGVLGAGDGYLVITVPGPFGGNLGAFSTTAYSGNWNTAGITQVRMWLNDIGTPDSLEMHVCIGSGATGNLWQSNAGLIPPHGEWAPFTVDVSNPANFTFIGIGTPDFAAARAGADRMLIRHDHAPYSKSPDTIIGDVGIDEILLTNGSAGVAPNGRATAGAPVQLAPPAPNPSRGSVAFRLTAGANDEVRMQVVDALGRVVRQAVLAGSGSAARSWTWDGLGENGRPAAPGYYRVRAFGPWGGTSQPLVRVN